MAKEHLYEVRIPFFGCEIFEVWAENEEEALNKADRFEGHSLDKHVSEYDPIETWIVEKVDLGDMDLYAEQELEPFLKDEYSQEETERNKPDPDESINVE